MKKEIIFVVLRCYKLTTYWYLNPYLLIYEAIVNTDVVNTEIFEKSVSHCLNFIRRDKGSFWEKTLDDDVEEAASSLQRSSGERCVFSSVEEGGDSK